MGERFPGHRLGMFGAALGLVLLTPTLAAGTPRRAPRQLKSGLLRTIISEDKDLRQDLHDYHMSFEQALGWMRIRRVDLNRDGQWEYIVTLADPEARLVGALGNVPTWVCGRTGKRVRVLCRTEGRELAIRKSSTHGYRDLRSWAGDSATSSVLIVYRFDGRRYRERAAYERRVTRRRSRIIRIKPTEIDERLR